MNQSTEKVQDIERGARIKAERQRLKLSLVEFAKSTGISKGSQILYEKGNPPTADYLVSAGQVGARILYILTGVQDEDVEPRLGTQVRRPDGTVISTYKGRSSEKLEVSGNFAETSEGMIRLPIYREVRAAAGQGAAPVSEMTDGVMSFDPRFLRDQGAVPESCSVIWAHGDSMMPTIPDGSALIVDRSQTEVKNGSIMVIGIGDDLLVKRVRRRLDGLIDLISDNSAYAPETLGPASLQQLRVIGRVVYFCRTP